MSAQPKKKRGILAGIFLVDPWRKLLALGLGFISWYYVSTKITNTKVLLFRVTPVRAGKAEYNANALNIPVPEGFVLWSVNGVPMEKKPKVRILFQGPHNRMQKITEYLRLAVLSERLTKVSKGNLRIEIKAEDLVVPQDPGLNDLIKEIVGPDGRTPAPLVLDFEEYLRKVPFVLGKGETRVVGTACPEGYEIDPDKGIWFTPSQVELSGPGKVINGEILNRPLPHRERLLEDFLLHSDARVRRSPTEGWEIVARLGLSTAWILKGVTLFPAQVEAHLPLRRVPSLINIPRLRIPVEFSGPGASNWKIVKDTHPDRPVIVYVYNKNYWWRVINGITLPSRSNKEDKVAQEKWVLNNVRLMVNVSYLDPKKPGEQSAYIHWVLLPYEKDVLFNPADIKVEVRESDRIPVIWSPPAKKKGKGQGGKG